MNWPRLQQQNDTYVSMSHATEGVLDGSSGLSFGFVLTSLKKWNELRLSTEKKSRNKHN